MFTLWRKIELAETAYFRPLAGYSTSNLNDSKQLEALKRGMLWNMVLLISKENLDRLPIKVEII